MFTTSVHSSADGGSLRQSPERKEVPTTQIYGAIVGRGTKKTKAQKLRDICGNRVPSADMTAKVAEIIKQEQRPKPHKRQLGDGQIFALDNQ